MILEDIKSRARIAKRRNKSIGIIFLIVTLITVIMFLINKGVGIAFIIIDVIILVVWISVAVFSRSELEIEIFHNCIRPKLENSFKDFKYNQTKLDHRIIRDLRIIDTGDRMSILDQIEGIYRNTSFLSCGLVCERRTIDSDGDTDYVDTFRGRLVIIGKSVLNVDANVDIIDSRIDYRKHYTAKKFTINHPVEKEFDVFVSDPSASIPLSFLDYINSLKELYPQYLFNIRICNDRIYMFINHLNPKMYSVGGDLSIVSEDDLDFVIKKDSAFITNTISSILDGSGGMDE